MRGGKVRFSGRFMLISSNPQPTPAIQTSQTSPTATAAGKATSTPSPAVINSVIQGRGSLSTIVTADFVQKTVDAVNEMIAGYNNIDWSRFQGVTPQQLQAGRAHNAKQFQATEQDIVLLASRMGVTGVELTFTPITGDATSADGLSPETGDRPAIVLRQSDGNPAVTTGLLREPNTPGAAPSATTNPETTCTGTIANVPPHYPCFRGPDRARRQFFDVCRCGVGLAYRRTSTREGAHERIVAIVETGRSLRVANHAKKRFQGRVLGWVQGWNRWP